VNTHSGTGKIKYVIILSAYYIMDNVSNVFSKYINRIYHKSGYLDKYGGSLVATALTLLIFFLIFSYYYTLNHLKPIKANWIKSRCHPAVMPFAGMINAPPDQGKLDFTAENFSQCISSILTEVVHFFLEPVYYASHLITELFGALAGSIQEIRKLFNIIREQLMAIVVQIMNRIMNVLVPLRIIMGKLQTIMGKTEGVLTASLYTVLTLYLSMRAFMGAFIEIIILFLIVLAAAAVVLWILIFTFPAAAVLTALFVAVSVPFILILVALFRILHLTTSHKVPPNPKCFGGDTLVELRNGDYVSMENVRVGDELATGASVSAKFTLTSTGEDMYKLGDAVVSGSHMVLDENKGWTHVRNHFSAEPINDYREPMLYCINTANKVIRVGDYIFSDWDEMDAKDCENLRYIAAKHLPVESELKDIHRYMDGGFTENTQIELEDGQSIPIKDIAVGDQLRFGERVLGTVEIDARDLSAVKSYDIKGYTFCGGPNIRIEDNDLGNKSTLDMDGTRIKTPPRLYHLVTDTKLIMINGIRFCDYNGGLEKILWPSEFLPASF